MAQAIPTLAQISAAYLAQFESKINQNSPLNDKAFLQVLSDIEAAGDAALYRYAINRAKANLVLTATGPDLDAIGKEYGVTRKPATPARFTITLPASNGTVIPASSIFIGDDNGVVYIPDSASAPASGSLCTLNVQAEAPSIGILGNLIVGQTMSISSQVAGVQTDATITVVLQVGVDVETDDDYRPRIQTVMWNVAGGGNAMQYKIWAETVSGVKAAYPYTGNIAGATSYPGERTIYVEADSSVNADGIAPSGMLTSVRTAIDTNPTSGLTQTPLGQGDSTLYIWSITRNSLNVIITDIVVASTSLTAAKAAVSVAIDLYMRSLKPFIPGIDNPGTQNNLVTGAMIAEVVQEVLSSYGGSAGNVALDVSGGVYTIPAGELEKLGTVTYV